jgi:hypothetical protein
MFCNREKNNQMERIRALKLNLNPGTNKDNKKVRKKFNISFEKKIEYHFVKYCEYRKWNTKKNYN